MKECISSNRPEEWQTREQVILEYPFVDRPFGEKSPEPKKIPIDACIAPVIKHLWEHNIVTRNSCCGHGYKNPEIIVDENTHPQNADMIRKLIAEVDEREFGILSWKLTKI